VKDNLVDVAGLSLESLGEQRLRVGGVGPGKDKRVGVGRAFGVRDRIDEDNEDDPRDEDVPAMTNTESSEGFQEGSRKNGGSSALP
jgi:hypothetical protein